MAVYLTALLATVSCCSGVVLGTKLKFKDCDQVRQAGYIESGIYTLWRDDSNSFKVRCHHEPSNSYTFNQQRVDDSVNFTQPWRLYQYGFGNINGNYWAGLNTIYYLASKGHNVLSVDMLDWNNTYKFTRYSHFYLTDQEQYTLSIGGYSGNVHDDLSYNNGRRFATYDKPDTYRCAKNQHGGWWYWYCTYALPNGKYYYNGSYPPDPSGRWFDGIFWSNWTGFLVVWAYKDRKEFPLRQSSFIQSTSADHTQPDDMVCKIATYLTLLLAIVHCQHEANNSFTLIQRRVDGSVNFAQPWHIYQTGFGSENSNYWAGLNTIYYLTYTGHNVLSITMQDWNNNIRTARYSHFKLQDSYSYTLSIGGYSGNVPDDLSHNNNMRFATYDKPDIHHCATNQHAGWWYNYCTNALPNGKYYYYGPYPPSGGWYDGIYWSDWLGYNYSLKYISMTLSTS
ncbi:hypothetical protein FSP39_024993 [Pinctada imbricata]|uniref:Fibrinogen C-terminal domain-containing protein n=1 Tax=Pinctada imbricata TaxID=66713 RepID=A0AA88YF22_PINIB|nr:hypothetical protein FSP39_024993 [Pinctada imbricata]